MTGPRRAALSWQGLVWQSTRGSRVRAAVLALVVLVGAGATAAIPVLVGWTIDRLVGEASLRVVLAAVATLALLAGGSALLVGVRIALSHRIAEDMVARLRRDTFAALSGARPLTLEARGPGEALAALTVDIEALRAACRDAVPQVAAAVALLLWAIGAMVVLSPQLSLVVLCGLPLVVGAALWFRRASGPAYLAQRAELARTVGRLGEDLRGAATAVSFGRDADRRAGLSAAHEAYLRTEYRAMWTRNRFFPLLVAVEGVVAAAVIGVGGVLSINGSIGVGVVATFALAIGQVFGPVHQLSSWVDLIQAASAAARRICDAQRIDDDAQQSDGGAGRALPATGALELDGVRFGYTRQQPVLLDVTLRVDPGEWVALTGQTGAGKSTVGRLLVRWAEPDHGTVRFGGVDLRQVDRAAIRERIMLLPQEGLNFSGTVGDVIRLVAPGRDDEQIRHVLADVAGSRVAVEDEAADLPAGYSQLLALAAVVLADPAAVILDESTAALDPAVSERVDQTLGRVLRGRAVLVIAHRQDTIARCDRVVHLSGGRLAPPAVSVEQ